MDRDGIVEITVSSDGMAAFASFLPAIGAGRAITREYVEQVIEEHGIVHGVDSDAITDTLLAVLGDHHARDGVLIARGREAVASRPGFYRITVRQGEPVSVFSDSERIDYRSVTRLPVVRAGEQLAVAVAPREGTPGITVRGEEIPPGVEPVDRVEPGRNTRVVGDTVVAEIGGQFQLREGTFLVEDRLEISDGVGYGTGSIEFPGDVILKGEVKDGFHIWAGRNIHATVPVDVSEIYCRGEFTSVAGLIGRGRALLRAGGRVQVRFIGNCAVETKSTIFVKQYVFQSHVACLGRLATGDHGAVIGGVVTAGEGVRCATIGNEAGVTTTIRVGIDFIVERRLRLIREKLIELTTRLDRMKAALDEDPTDRRLEIVNRLEETRQTLLMQMGELSAGLDAHEDAEVVVDGVVHPGVQIAICRATHAVDEAHTAVRFRLDKAAGRVVMESLKES